MSDHPLVWSDGKGDLRKENKKKQGKDEIINESLVQLNLRRLTAGKGRTVIEITGLPNNKKWCQDLAKKLKQALGAGGSFKNNRIEIHGENIQKIMDLLDTKKLKWKKTGG